MPAGVALAGEDVLPGRSRAPTPRPRRSARRAAASGLTSFPQPPVRSRAQGSGEALQAPGDRRAYAGDRRSAHRCPRWLRRPPRIGATSRAVGTGSSSLADHLQVERANRVVTRDVHRSHEDGLGVADRRGGGGEPRGCFARVVLSDPRDVGAVADVPREGDRTRAGLGLPWWPVAMFALVPGCVARSRVQPPAPLPTTADRTLLAFAALSAEKITRGGLG